MLKRRALLSVSDKSGIVEFASGLVAAGFELISTGGTLAALREAGLAVTAVADVTGAPELLDGRVKTLHPKIHGAILARPTPEHLAQCVAHDIFPIDVVAVNLYPFAATVARPGATFADAVENIDIGGPAMVRAAAKNHERVLIVVAPQDYGRVVAALTAGNPETLAALRRELAGKAFAHTAGYDAMIANYLATGTPWARPAVEGEGQPAGAVAGEGAGAGAGPGAITADAGAGGRGARGGDTATAAGAGMGAAFPENQAWTGAALSLQGIQVSALRYGENPHQQAALYAWRVAPSTGQDAAFSLTNAQILSGKQLSYNNYLDLDAALGLVAEFQAPAAVIVKHNNPCGVAVDHSAAVAYRRARAADELSAFGGIVAFNDPVDADAAAALAETFLECVVAPAFTAEALAVLAPKKNLRLVVVPKPWPGPEALTAWEVRTLRGGFLLQQRDASSEQVASSRVVTVRQPRTEELGDLQFAWLVAKHVKSNAIVFARDGATVAIGAGQMSRVDSVRICERKGGEALRGAVVASDAFFPFRDGVDVLAATGATAIVQPGGSVRDEEVIAAANEHGLAMVFTGVRHFRH